MNVKGALTELVRAIADEADRNADFRARIERALGVDNSRVSTTVVTETKRRGGRRTPAVLDPIELARHGEDSLRAQLAGLDIERLRDIVAQYGMDPGKLVMKWKDSDRVINRIVEIALARATKGDAFRSH
jgi:hypothetical protein